MKNTIRKVVLALIIPIGVAIAWELATKYGNLPAGVLPSIPMVCNTFIEMVKSGQLQTDLMISLVRVVKGFFVSGVLGIILGALIGMFKPVKELFLPIITVIRQIPIIAWIPLIILWAGIGETSKVVIIVLAAFFPVLVNTESGMESTPEGLIEVAKLYKLSKWETFVKVYLPNSLPHILVGLKLALGISWMAVVAAELIASVTGIGYRMSYARSMMQADVVIVCMLVVGLIGIIMDKLTGVLFSYFTPWQKVKKK